MKQLLPIYTRCGRCARSFANHYRLKQHIMNSSKHEYCHRCNTYCSVGDEDNLVMHRATSLNHWQCPIASCGFDLLSEVAKHEHIQEQHPFFCNICDIDFKTLSNLQSRNFTHMGKHTTCLRCPRAFINDSSAMVHLEAGTCESGWNFVDVNQQAERVYQSKHYVVRAFAKVLRTKQGRQVLDEYKPYYCEGAGCGARFNLLSALLMHAERDTCNIQINGAPLGACLHRLHLCRRTPKYEPNAYR